MNPPRRKHRRRIYSTTPCTTTSRRWPFTVVVMMMMLMIVIMILTIQQRQYETSCHCCVMAAVTTFKNDRTSSTTSTTGRPPWSYDRYRSVSWWRRRRRQNDIMNPTKQSLWYLIRGGGGGDDDSSDNEDDDSFLVSKGTSSSPERETRNRTRNTNDDTQNDNETILRRLEPPKIKSVMSWLLGDLFWNDESSDIPTTTSQCSLSFDTTQNTTSIPSSMTSLTSTMNNNNNNNNNNNVTQTTGRGGALVKHKLTFRNRFLPLWWSPLSSSIQQHPLPLFVSDLQQAASRLLFQNDNGDNDNSNDTIQSSYGSDISSTVEATSKSTSNSITATVTQRITKSVVASANSVSSTAWWVDTWADHLPDDDDDNDDDIDLHMDETSRVDHSNVTHRTLTVASDRHHQEQIDQEYYDVAIVHQERNRTVLSNKIDSSKHHHTLFNAVDDDDDISTSTTQQLQHQSPNTDQLDIDIPLSAVALNTTTTPAVVTPSRHEINTSSTMIPPIWNTTTTTSRTLPTTSNNKNTSFIDPNHTESLYISSGSWHAIDHVVSLGYADTHPNWRISSRLRTIRKGTARITGLHGFLSGKPPSSKTVLQYNGTDMEDPKMGLFRRRLAAIDRARQNIERITMAQNKSQERSFPFWNRNKPMEVKESLPDESFIRQTEQERIELWKRTQRVKEIDALIQSAQKQLAQLACEKDVLQQRPNPLWNYTTTTTTTTAGAIENIDNGTIGNENNSNNSSASAEDPSPSSDRTFNFPSPDLVDEYIETLFITGRLIRMNQTELWRQSNDDEDEDVDELMSPPSTLPYRRNGNTMNSNTAAPWLLRNFVGEKIGEAVEMAAYKAVCTSLMTILAKGISNLHGMNVMGYSDIRLYTEETPMAHHPPMGEDGPANDSTRKNMYRNYAQEAFQDVMRRGSHISSTKRPPRSTFPPTPYHHPSSPASFIQRDAIVETLTSQCQIAAPLLNLFPLSLQRALISNIVIMCTAIITDFFEGMEFHILGHRLSFSFQPITEEDMMRNMIRDRYQQHHHHSPSRARTHPDVFEAAVRATAEEVSDNLNILDRWHERALGSGVLRTQIATIIARLVLTLVDDILRAARMDLWSNHAGGPKLSAALEYRPVLTPTMTSTKLE